MSIKNFVGYIDSNGEIHEGDFPVFIRNRQAHSPYGEQWMQVNQNFLMELCARKDLGTEDFRVFMYLNGCLNFENEVKFSQYEAARHMGMPRQSVNRSMHKLEALGIIIRGPRVGRLLSYRLNPHAGWKGKVRHLRTALDKNPPEPA